MSKPKPIIVKSKKTIASLRRGEETIKDNKNKKGKTLSAKDKARALASPANRAMSAKQVKKDLEKKNPPPWMKEDFDFKVNIDGFPEMFMSGNSPGEVKAHLRKLVKQPSMIQSVDRVTKHDKKKHHRDKVNEGMKYTHAAIDKSGKVIGMASQESDAKDMARRNKGRVVKLKKPMSDKKGDMMINRQFKEGGMKRKSTGDGMDTFKKKPPENESYAPDEGTPAARKKASKMTPGQEGVMDFLKNVGNTVMYGTQKSKPTQSQPRSRINTNRNSTSGGANSIASRINFGGKYGNK